MYGLGCLSVFLHQVTQRLLGDPRVLTQNTGAELLRRFMFNYFIIQTETDQVWFCAVIGQEPLSIIELWRKFRSLRPDFISSYAAYHLFRSRGWVPKGGGAAKYGADLSKYTV